MTDGEVVVADEHLADNEPDDLLALLDGQALGVGAQPRAEAVEGLGELEVGLGVVQLGVDRRPAALGRRSRACATRACGSAALRG